MIKGIDFSEIKKLILFIFVMVSITVLAALVSKGGMGQKRSEFVKKQVSVKPHFAVNSESKTDKALEINNTDLYQLKDPFAPLLSTGLPQSEGRLAAGISEVFPEVNDIYVKSGKEKAEIVYNSKTLIAGEHQEFGHFYVSNIDSLNKKVVFIYGDEKIVVKEKTKNNSNNPGLKKETGSAPKINGPSSILGPNVSN